MALKTRKPTGRTGWPIVLVEGGDKTGKSWSLAALSASPKVGRTVVLVLGESESRWDEYGRVPGARFEIAEHDGAWASIMGVAEDAKAEAVRASEAGEPPFVLGIDTMTAVWEGLKDWASLRARGSKKNKALLEQDPNAEIDVTANFWNDARKRHRALMRVLLTFPGIVVMIARGSEVTLFQNGQPVLGRKTWSVETEKNLPFDASMHIRLSRDSRPLLVSVSSVECSIRPGVDPPRRLPDDWSLESVVFDTIKLDPAAAEARDFVEFRQERTAEEIRDEAIKAGVDPERVRELYREAAASKQLGVELENESGKVEPLKDILVRRGKQRAAATKPDLAGMIGRPQPVPVQPQLAVEPQPEIGDDWQARVDEISSADDVDPALNDLNEALGNGMAEDKYKAVLAAIEVKAATFEQGAAA